MEASVCPLSLHLLAAFGVTDPHGLIVRNPDTSSPDDLIPSSLLPDPSAPATTKKVYHRCAKCELVVAQKYEDPDPHNFHLVLKQVDTVFLPQFGPVCGAASVAGTVKSLLRHHNFDVTDPDSYDAVTVRLVQELYHAQGVPDIFVTSAAVGNQTIKRAFMTLRVPGLPGVSFAAKDLACLLERDPVEKAQAEWRMLKAGMGSGARYLFHSRNHYNRVFGWRELWDSGEAAAATSTGGGDDLALTPAGWRAVLAEANGNAEAAVVAVLREAKEGGQEEGGVVKTGEAASGEGGGSKSSSSSAQVAVVDSENGPPIAPVVRAAGDRAPRPLSLAAKKRLRAGLDAGVASTTMTAPSSIPSSSSSTPDFSRCVARRQILMAKKGQRPAHWVDWERVCEDIAAHKGHHMIFEVRLVERGSGAGRR
jgi:hypothetical protein